MFLHGRLHDAKRGWILVGDNKSRRIFWVKSFFCFCFCFVFFTIRTEQQNDDWLAISTLFLFFLQCWLTYRIRFVPLIHFPMSYFHASLTYHSQPTNIHHQFSHLGISLSTHSLYLYTFPLPTSWTILDTSIVMLAKILSTLTLHNKSITDCRVQMSSLSALKCV